MFLLKKEEEFGNKQMQPGESLFQYLKRKKQLALKQQEEKVHVKEQSRQLQNMSKATADINLKKSQQSYALDSARSRPSTKRKQRKSSSKKKRQVDSSIQSQKRNKHQKQNNYHFMNVLDNDIFRDQKTTRRAALHSRDDFKNVSINLQRSKQINDEQKPNENTNKPRSRSPFRSFISMISPLKNRSEHLKLSMNISQNQYQTKKNKIDQQQHEEERKQSIVKTAQLSTKKTIKQAITKVQRHYDKQAEFSLLMKQKIREFMLSVSSLIVHVEDDMSELPQGSQKKISTIKSQMKIINNFITTHFKQQEHKSISLIIESMYDQITQTLHDYEGKVNKNSQSSFVQSIQKVKLQYEKKLQQLNKQKQRLGRQVGTVNKENAKLIRDYDSLLEKYNTLADEKRNITKLQNQQQNQIKELYEQEIHTLTQKNNNLSQQLSTISKQLKQTQHQFEQHKKKTQIQKSQKTTSRQSYLLKQINQLKQQCAKDIENLNKYYVTKIDQYQGKIKVYSGLIEEQKLSLLKMDEKIIKLEDRLKTQDKQKQQIKVKLQESLIDMCKINEQLFKHWLALKDIKTLSLRLSLFDRFERIYRDIPFDDRMFIV